MRSIKIVTVAVIVAVTVTVTVTVNAIGLISKCYSVKNLRIYVIPAKAHGCQAKT
ncbi:hypothetical protein [Candidatus Uabimicrobium amorphum]|uniref:hypothetical protein n=1 Tax=Uabimicrobium amorphum TaxID=2596890 RepID=UPI001566AC0E|nr:hypothetical protein [Candidatus Uabimicrobium amorphum]